MSLKTFFSITFEIRLVGKDENSQINYMGKSKIETIFQRCNALYNGRMETEPGQRRQSEIMIFFWILTPIFAFKSLLTDRTDTVMFKALELVQNTKQRH